MTLFVLGVNHRSAPLEVREQIAFPAEVLPRALADAREGGGVAEVAILSTCNRTEIYGLLHGGSGAELLGWLTRYHGLPPGALDSASYFMREEAAARHMMRVACGLDSLVLGEPQILGQMKEAYTLAREAGALSGQLGRLFEEAFAVAKQVRTDTAIGENPVSVAYAAVTMARHIFADMHKTRALLIGAGDTTALVARHLKEIGVSRLVIANRSPERARTLADALGAEAVSLSEIPGQLPDADMVFAATTSPLPILGKGTMERAIRRRKHKPVFMVDLAVPRDIEPEVAELDDVYLYTVDDLRQVVESNLKSREGAAAEAEHLVEAGAARFMAKRRSRDAVATLKLFRAQAEALRQQELEKAERALRGGAAPEEVMAQLARGLTNKLLHEPSVRVREEASEGRHDAALWLRRLFRLGEDGSRRPARGGARSAAPESDKPQDDNVTAISRARRYNSGTE